MSRDYRIWQTAVVPSIDYSCRKSISLNYNDIYTMVDYSFKLWPLVLLS